MASTNLQPLGTFPFAIRTADGRHAKVIGHFTPLEWPPSEAAFDLDAADGGPSPVFVLTEMGSPAVLPAMRIGDADRVEWLDNEPSSAPARYAHSRLWANSPNLTVPPTSTHSGPSRRRSLPRLMRSKSDASRPGDRTSIGHGQPLLPPSENLAAFDAAEKPASRLSHVPQTEVNRKSQHGSSKSMSSAPSSFVASFSNWTVRKRNSMKRKSGEDLKVFPAPSSSNCEHLAPQPSPGPVASPSPYGDYPVRKAVRKRASMPAAWMQAVPIEQKMQSLAPPASPSRHASSHSMSTDTSAEAIRRLEAAREWSTSQLQPRSSSATVSSGNLLRAGSIKPSYVIRRKPVMDISPEITHSDFNPSALEPTHDVFAYATEGRRAKPQVKSVKPKQSLRSLISNQREDDLSDNNVLSYIQTKALSIFKRRLHRKAVNNVQPARVQGATKPPKRPVPLVKKVKSFVSLRHTNSSATSLSSVSTDTSSDDYDENAAVIMQAESVRLAYIQNALVEGSRDPACPMHGDLDLSQDRPPVSIEPLHTIPRENGLPRASSGSPWSQGSSMLPSLPSEEDIGVAISTDDENVNSTPSRLATISRARGKAYHLSCPSLVPDSISDFGSNSPPDTPDAGNSPVSTPSKPPKQMRAPPAHPPPSGPLPPIPFPIPRATPPLSHLAVPAIEVFASPASPVPETEEPVFKLYNPSRERFQEALDRVHDTVWHGSIRETQREHRRDCSMTSLSSEASKRFVMSERSRKAMSTANIAGDELTLESLLSSWSLCECSEDDSYVLQDNESGILDTLDWFDPKLLSLQNARE